MVLTSLQIDAIDLSDMQPTYAPQNVQWCTPNNLPNKWFDLTCDMWPVPAGTYDLIHASQLCGSIASWRSFIRNSFR